MATPASGGGSGAASWVSGWPSFAVVLLVALAAAYAFSPRPMPAFKPTVIAPEGLQVNAILRQGALFIAAGEQGRILLSESASGPWKEAKITPQRGSTLTQLRAIDAKTLIAVGHDGWIVRSEDAGLSWIEAAFDTEKSDPLLGVAGPYEGKLFAFGAFGKFMVSSDMGKTWAVTPIVEANAGGAAASAGAPGVVGGTADDPYGASAASAPPAPTAGGGAPGVAGATADDPYGANAAAAPAADANADPFANFSTQTSTGSIADHHFNAMTRAGDGALVLVGERGMVALSHDAGATWAAQNSGYTGSFYGVLSLPPSTVLAYGMRGNVFRSEDNGKTWAKSPTPNQLSLYGAASTIRHDLLLVGENSVVIASKDAGKTFSLASIGEQKRIAAAVALDNGDILTVGEGGIQLRDPYQSVVGPSGAQP